MVNSGVESDLQKVNLSDEKKTTIYHSEDVHRTKCQAPTIARLTHSLYTTEIASIRCYTMLSTKES